MRSSCLLAFFVAASMSSASFDLILVADNIGSSTGPVLTKVHRYDGDSGVYMGSFNTGTTLITDMAVNQAANEVYIAGSNRLLVMDYNTGSIKRQFNTGYNSVKFQNGRLYGTVGNQIREINITTGAVTIAHTASAAITDFVYLENGAFATYLGSTGVLQGFSASGVGGTPVTGLNTSFATNSVSLGVDGFSDNRFLMMGRAVNTTTSSSLSVFRATSVSTSGSLTNLSSGNFFSSYTNDFIHVDQAHNGNWMYGENNAGQNALYRLYTAAGTGDTYFTTPQVNTPGPIAVVLAPEPGTMVALGAGALALLRRRKKK